MDPEGPSVYRPEAGSYISNIAAANSLFSHRLHDRLGEPQYTDSLHSQGSASSMWMRHVGGHERSRAGDGQLNTQANRYVLQLGGDLAQWSSNAQDRWHLGVMAGYANQHSNTQSNRVGYKSDGRISGYSAGLYATRIRTMRIRPALMLTAGRCITGLITASVPITVLLTTMILAV